MRIAMIVACLIVIAAAAVPTLALEKQDLGRKTLASNDGWASEGDGTTGGSLAKSDQVYTVHNRQELIAALNDGVYPPPAAASNTPKIIYVDGVIDANVDDNNQPLTCQDYAQDGYTLEAYLAAYDPAVWGRANVPSGPLEAARKASQLAQADRVRIRVGSNTTIVGVGNKALIKGAWLDVRGTSTSRVKNIIIRNINFQDTFDCFPQWNPTDGSTGNWNAEYDSIALRYADNVWIDHNSFQDLETADRLEPTYFGRHYEQHDGECDITNASDLVTVSWNQFLDHDKVMLIGSSDSGTTAAGDRGKLRVTIHHNLFDNLGQRTPRVRFGQVHVYNNYYKIVNNSGYGYTWGVGIESKIYAENNYFQTDQSIAPDQLIKVFKGTAIHESGTRMNGTPGGGVTDVLAAYNAVNDPNLSGDPGWAPTLFLEIDETQRVVPAVESGSGPFNW
jgi:pectate lyase